MTTLVTKPAAVTKVVAFNVVSIGSGGGIGKVATIGDLPTSNNQDGDVKLVLADYSLHVWKAGTSQWSTLSGGSGGVIPSGTPANLFVQQTQPIVADIVIDSLWIPIDSGGNPAPPNQWQVYTGTGDGNGGNLVIQQSAPVGLGIDCLWIPTLGSGAVTDFFQWRVFTGHGSVAGSGNPNLFIQPTQPLAIDTPSGSLWIPLNSDQSPKTVDNWRVYA